MRNFFVIFALFFAVSLAGQFILPFNQPYSVSPWYYNGAETLGEFDNIVDWVLVETWTGAAYSSLVFQEAKSCLLLSSGAIVDINGTIPQFTGKEYLWVVIRHRNHLAVVSSGSLPSPVNGITSWDFSSGSGQAYNGTLAHKEVESGVWAMFAANANGDFLINNADKYIY